MPKQRDLSKGGMSKSQSLRKNKRIITKFFAIVGSIVGVFAIFASAAVLGYFSNLGNDGQSGGATAQANTMVTPSPKTMETKEEKKEGVLINAMLPPRKTNFLIVGLDQGDLLSDTIMVGSFDRENLTVHLISVPRDTYVTLSKEAVKELQDAGRHPPSSGIMKINAVHSWAGANLGTRYLQEEIEDMMGIEIQYYAEIGLDAFKKIVDLVDGVEMEIPQGGLHYYDPTQNLRINVPGGLQILDGEMAEGVVRYRATYRRGDLQRIEVQQEFMKQLFKQVLNKNTIINNAAGFLSIILQNVKTNFTVGDIPKYIRYLKDLDAEKFHVQTLPGVPETINGASYFVHDPAETKMMVQEVFYSTDSYQEQSLAEDETENPEAIATASSSPKPTASPSPKPTQHAQLNIQVLNGGIINGLASQKSALLQSKGFTVSRIGDYNGSKKDETRIMVRKKSDGEALENYFQNTVIEVDHSLPAEYDVIIILGLDETK